MKAVSTALVAVSFAASFVGAWDTYAPKFDTPGNTDCSCSSQQQQGFNWNGLNNGPVSSYGGFGLTGGLSCQSTGKRDGFGGKCVVGSCSKSGGPGIACPANQDKFSISQMHVSSEFDTDVECHYTMPDNSKCVETHSCSKSGSVITPSQCGGAKSMSIVLPSAHPSSSCSFSISSVGFHCGSATVTPFPSTSSYHAKTSSTPAQSTHVESSSHSVYSSESKSTVPTSSAAAKTSSTPVVSSKPVYTPASSSKVESSSSKVESSSSKVESSTTPISYKPTTSSAAAVSSSSESKSTESKSTPATVYTSEVIITTTTSCSAGHEITSVVTSPTVSTIIQTSTETITSCAASVTDCPARSSPVTSVHTLTTTSSCSVGQTIKSTLTAPTVLTTTYKSTQAITTSAVPSSTPAAVSSSPSSSAAAVSTTVSKVYTVITTCSAGETVTPTSGMPYILPSPSVITSVQTSYGSAPVSSAPASSAPASSAPASSAPASSSAAGVTTPASSAPATVTSVTTSVTSTTCPPGYTVTPAGGKPTTLTAPSVSSYIVTQTNTYTSAGTVPNAPASTPAAPTVLPRCLNSFQAQGCTDNTDSSCYCKDATYITNAINCAVAHGESPSDVASAISYLQGICAPQIPQNPAIVTAVPSTVTVVPVASPTGSSISAGVTQCPSTVITYQTTVSGSAINTVITAPQVSFASASSGAALVPATTTAAAVATSAPAPATSAPAAGAPATYAPAPAAASSTAAAASTFVPSYVSTPAAYTPTSTPAAYKGAATKQTVGGAAAGIVGLAAFMLL